jgi:RIO kinase 1
MSSDKFLRSKDLKRLDRELESLISRVGLDRKTQDEVFDKSTLHAIEKLISDHVIDIIDFPISTGKEGNVFRSVKPEKKLVAVKIYRINTATFKHISDYIIGDPRFKNVHKSKRDIIFAWTKKEFKNLQRLQRIGVLAPAPIQYLKNVLVMSYIGSKRIAAPLLRDVTISNPKEIFDTLIDYISKMYKKADLVHGDFSAFNILIYRKKPYLIDLGQGVLIEHHNSIDYLKRDIHNIVSYFKKYKIMADEEEIFKEITKKQ